MPYFKNNFWNNANPLSKYSEKLNKLIPDSGSVEQPKKNKALEKFRKAQNCYYDLYNNGLGNRASEFRSVFGIASSQFKYAKPYFVNNILHHVPTYRQSMFESTEVAMNGIVIKAIHEQLPDLYNEAVEALKDYRPEYEQPETA